MSEELEYEINQRVTELAREMHEKEKSEFEQLQVQLERIDCKKVYIGILLQKKRCNFDI